MIKTNMTKSTGKEIKKATTLWEHLNQITSVQNPKYWDTLSKEDRRSWSNFMVLRFLSMEPDFVEIISELQPIVQTLEPELLYKVLIGIIPKGKRYLKYTKGKGSDKYEPWLIEYVTHQFECSTEQATDYLEILYGTDTGHSMIKKLCAMYGTDPKLIKKLKLNG